MALALITSKHFYPRSPCGERRNRLAPADVDGRISIHALLAESDASLVEMPRISAIFLSTLSLRRATVVALRLRQVVGISIHALLAESDAHKYDSHCHEKNFYPRSPCGERLPVARRTSTTGVISIHALLAESDNTGQPVRGLPSNFYPRSPCGERLYHNTRLLSNHTFLSTLSLRRATPRRPAQQQKGQFLSTLSLRRATFNPHFFRPARTISIHALLAESDRLLAHDLKLCPISIHALLAESDPVCFAALCPLCDFYPRSPCGERHRRIRCIVLRQVISIHALLAESDANGRCARIVPGISIHALLAESDPRCRRRRSCQAISIHALLAESDLRSRCRYRCTWPFLSTLSLRRATTASRPLNAGISDFYPRSPCGERPHYWHPAELRSNFYPRSPCGERRAYRDHDCYNEIFLSTLSLRRATHKHGQLQQGHVISIHALLAESDLVHVGRVRKDCYFYPRSPCGERPPVANLKSRRRNFYPRSPCGERRGNSGTQADPAKSISIHALLAESDAPRSRDNSMGRNISIHALLAESDLHCQL